MSQVAFLLHAQELEKSAASQRVSYYSRRVATEPLPDSRLLDVGCGNGYAVKAWQDKGVNAIGVDYSLYRLSRWVSEHDSGAPLVVADAKNLPFKSGSFDTVVSSGMIEHIGVDETTNPYTARAQPTQSSQRETAIRELVRVGAAGAKILIDCPNGGFPVDFWHGDRIGSFRLHPIPDPLNPTYGHIVAWAESAGTGAALLPLKGRLSFRQIRNRWWGRVLFPLALAQLALVDLLISLKLYKTASFLQPYLVVRLAS